MANQPRKAKHRKSTWDWLRISPTKTPPIPDLFSDLSKFEHRSEQILLIKAYCENFIANKSLLQMYIEAVYHPMVILDLPPEVPPYHSPYLDFDDAPSDISKALKRIKYFVKGNQFYIENKTKREALFIRTLEEMHKENAELYLSILFKEIDESVYPTVNDALFFEAYPEWFPEGYQPKKTHLELTLQEPSP